MNLKQYINEMLFHAAVGNPWDVSEAEFVAIVALLNDGTKLTMQERADALRFFQVACDEAASIDASAADVATVHRLACESARRRGIKVRNVSPL